MTETTPTPTDPEVDAAAAAEFAALPKKDRDALVDLGVEGRAALAELVAAGADPAPAEEPAEVAPSKGRGIVRSTGGTVTDRARRAAEIEEPTVG